MKADKVNNFNNPYFGTKVIISPNVVKHFCSHEEVNIKKQISMLEKNGKDDVLFLYKASPSNLGAELYYKDGKRIVSSYNVEEPFHRYPNKSGFRKLLRTKIVNIVELYNKACDAVSVRTQNDKRIGIRFEKWLNNIPGIKE